MPENDLKQPLGDDEGAPDLAAPLPLHVDELTPAAPDSTRAPADSRSNGSLIVPVVMNSTHTSDSNKRNGKHGPVCPFCFSADTMEPFRRSPHVTLLSRIIPRLRWRYCRSCTRHFLSIAPRHARTS